MDEKALDRWVRFLACLSEPRGRMFHQTVVEPLTDAAIMGLSLTFMCSGFTFLAAIVIHVVTAMGGWLLPGAVALATYSGLVLASCLGVFILTTVIKTAFGRLHALAVGRLARVIRHGIRRTLGTDVDQRFLKDVLTATLPKDVNRLLLCQILRLYMHPAPSGVQTDDLPELFRAISVGSMRQAGEARQTLEDRLAQIELLTRASFRSMVRIVTDPPASETGLQESASMPRLKRTA